MSTTETGTENKNRFPWGTALALTFLLTLPATFLVATTTSPLKKVEYVYADPGGTIATYVIKYSRLDREGGTLEIDGFCASACTYFLGIMDPEKVCATERATLGFHGAYSFDVFDPDWTPWYHARYLTPRILEVLKSKGFDGTVDVDRKEHPTGLIWLDRDEAGIQHC